MPVRAIGYLAAFALSVGATSGRAQADSTVRFQVSLTAVDGALIGDVVLGMSHPADLQRMLARVGGLGPKRDNRVTFTIGATELHPRELYTPPATMNQLYFDRGLLVLVVEGIPRGLPAARTDFVSQFPEAKETRREAGWYELQVQLRDCLWLIAVFGITDDKLESDAYAYTCGKP